MMFQNITRVVVVLAATATLAQGTPPGTTPGAPTVSQRPGFAGRKGMPVKKTADLQPPVSLRQRVQDMDSRLEQMHKVLKQMHDRSAKNKAKDSLAEANLDMWELMVGHLDKELQQLKIAVAAREDMEARRATLYKQADAKAEAEAQAARASQAAKFAAGAPTPVAAGQGAGESPAGQTAPKEAYPAPKNNSPSPN